MSNALTKFQPQSLAELEKLSAMIAVSQFAPKQMAGKPADCAIAIMMGSEIGLAPLQALQNIAVVNGKPSVYGDAVLALIRASGMCEYFTETISEDGQVAKAATKRKGEAAEEVRTFSVDDAKKAQLWGKQGPWTQYPRRMLQMRARGFLARDVYPDCLKGLITREEAEDYPTQTERQVEATVVVEAKPAVPALTLEDMKTKTLAFVLDKGLPVTKDEIDAADSEEKLRELCRRKPAPKPPTTDFPGPKKEDPVMDFTTKPRFAGSTIGNQNGSN